MTGAEIVNVITAVIALIGALTAAYVAVRQASMRKTVDHTLKISNSAHDALRAFAQKQGIEMHQAGLPPTTDDSLKAPG